MDLSATRAHALETGFDLLGTPMTATVPGGSPVSTKVKWAASDLEDAGRSRQLNRSFWAPTTDLPAVPRGTLFVGPEPQGGNNKTWRVDQILDREHGQTHVAVSEVLS